MSLNIISTRSGPDYEELRTCCSHPWTQRNMTLSPHFTAFSDAFKHVSGSSTVHTGLIVSTRHDNWAISTGGDSKMLKALEVDFCVSNIHLICIFYCRVIFYIWFPCSNFFSKTGLGGTPAVHLVPALKLRPHHSSPLLHVISHFTVPASL